MANSQKVVVPILAWYGDTELELDFPKSWDVTLCSMRGHDAPSLSDSEIRKAFANPIGTKTIKELAKGKRGVVTCPLKIGPLEMRDSCRITTGGNSCENKKIFGGAGISDSPGG